MSCPIKILIVEDEMIIAAKISMHLTHFGYEVSGIVPTGEEAVTLCKQNPPDILLLDINLKGGITGIETAQRILEKADIPIIYLTANDDKATFELAKTTRPFAFITKPYQKIELQRTLELVVGRLNQSTTVADLTPKNDTNFLDDRIFVRHKESMVKLYFSDICYIKADRSYCQIFTEKTKYLLSVPLKKLEDKLQANHFFRIHRSYLINLERIDEISEHHIVVVHKKIPIGTSYKESFLKRINKI